MNVSAKTRDTSLTRGMVYDLESIVPRIEACDLEARCFSIEPYYEKFFLRRPENDVRTFGWSGTPASTVERLRRMLKVRHAVGSLAPLFDVRSRGLLR